MYNTAYNSCYVVCICVMYKANKKIKKINTVAVLIVGVSIMAMADRFETRHAKKLSVTLRKEQHRRSTGYSSRK